MAISHLSGGQILGNEGHLRRPCRARTDLPRLGLQRITRLDRGSESNSKELQCARIVVCDDFDDGTSSEAEGR